MNSDGLHGLNPATTGIGTAVLALVSACASPVQRSTTADLRSTEQRLSAVDASAAPDKTAFDGSLSAYLGYAFARNPALRATFEDWRAATQRRAQERRLPEPTISYAAFLSAVETRVGPQRHRLGAKQWFPWPSKLGAGGRAASLEAQAAQQRFEAHALLVAAAVASAYWDLWRVHRQRDVVKDEVAILASLSEQIRARVEVAMAELSDLAQVDLMVSRARDRLAGFDELERISSARLVFALGAPDGTPTPVVQLPPRVEAMDETAATLTAEAGQHPQVAALAARSDAQLERQRQARAERFPSFGVGVDWIMTGRSRAAAPPPDSGKDAVAVSLSVTVPLWGRSYGAAEAEARARGAAYRARSLHARNAIASDVRQQLARVDDDVRRVRVNETTLLPQAEAAFHSVASSYASGRSSIAELLLAERALIGLHAELYGAQADYGTHIAELESTLGRPVRTKEQTDDQR